MILLYCWHDTYYGIRSRTTRRNGNPGLRRGSVTDLLRDLAAYWLETEAFPEGTWQSATNAAITKAKLHDVK